MEKKTYSNSFHTLEAIWRVLRRFSSPRHPLTVREIHDYLQRLETDPPSLSTLERALRDGMELMDLLFPGQVLPAAGDGRATSAYREGDTLHVVVGSPAEGSSAGKEAGVEATLLPFRAPSYSSIDKLLKEGLPFDLGTFPYRLRCVAKVPGEHGRPTLIPYEKWEEHLEAHGEARNNVPRRYYLSSALTHGEWRLLADLVRDYPGLSEQETQKFLQILRRFDPKLSNATFGSYPFKRGLESRITKITEILERAMVKRRKVRILYGEYQLKKQNGSWRPTLVQRERDPMIDLEPYALTWSNGNYYLLGKGQGMVNLRVDRIIGVGILAESFDPLADFDPARYQDSSSMMCPGRPTFVHLRCRANILDALVDQFGSLAHYTSPGEDGTVEVTMNAVPQGVKLFALQHLDSVEILEPASLRKELLADLRKGAEKYGSDSDQISTCRGNGQSKKILEQKG